MDTHSTTEWLSIHSAQEKIFATLNNWVNEYPLNEQVPTRFEDPYRRQEGCQEHVDLQPEASEPTSGSHTPTHNTPLKIKHPTLFVLT